jgi:hypothetical protein
VELRILLEVLCNEKVKWNNVTEWRGLRTSKNKKKIFKKRRSPTVFREGGYQIYSIKMFRNQKWEKEFM